MERPLHRKASTGLMVAYNYYPNVITFIIATVLA